MTLTQFRIPAKIMLTAIALIAAVMLAFAAQQGAPLDLRSSNIGNTVSNAKPDTPKTCPPTAAYGKGQKPGTGCQEKTPPGKGK